MNDHWYILFTQTDKQSQLCSMLRSEQMNAFLPVMEYFRRDSKGLSSKTMFPGYVFIRSEKNQKEFDRTLDSLKEKMWGFVKQLKDDGVAAMRPEEIRFFEQLLDENGVARMSYGYLDSSKKNSGKAVITQGPLEYFQERIVKVDKHNRLAWLDFEFMNRRVQVGLTIEPKKRTNESKSDKNPRIGLVESEDGMVEVDLEALKSKMMSL